MQFNNISKLLFKNQTTYYRPFIEEIVVSGGIKT
jgi:hypothetical protein